MITVKREAEAKKLCVLGLRFGGVVKVVERYWEAGPSSVCMICCGIGYQQMKCCGDWPQKCIIYASFHKMEDHQCGVAGCKKRKGKICVYVTPKCANCTGAHAANSLRCTSRHKAEINTRKEKKTKKIQKAKMPNAISEPEASPRFEASPEPEASHKSETSFDIDEVNPNPDMGMDLIPK